MKKILYTFLLVSLTLASCQKEQIKAEPVTASDYLWKRPSSGRQSLTASESLHHPQLREKSSLTTPTIRLFRQPPVRSSLRLGMIPGSTGRRPGHWMFKSTIPTENPTHLLPHFRFLSLQIRQLRLKVQGSL